MGQFKHTKLQMENISAQQSQHSYSLFFAS